MKHQYLEVTFRRGKPLVAYLYLPRTAGAKSARSVDAGRGMRIDYDADGAPIAMLTIVDRAWIESAPSQVLHLAAR